MRLMSYGEFQFPKWRGCFWSWKLVSVAIRDDWLMMSRRNIPSFQVIIDPMHNPKPVSTVDGWNPGSTHQLRLVVYPIIYKVLYIKCRCLGFLPSTGVLILGELFQVSFVWGWWNISIWWLGGARWYIDTWNDHSTWCFISMGGCNYQCFSKDFFEDHNAMLRATQPNPKYWDLKKTHKKRRIKWDPARSNSNHTEKTEKQTKQPAFEGGEKFQFDQRLSWEILPRRPGKWHKTNKSSEWCDTIWSNEVATSHNLFSHKR